MHRALGFGIAAATAALLFAAPAGADPAGATDPQHPDYVTGWCPGRGIRAIPGLMSGTCDGAPYPDGSFWRMTYQPGAFWGMQYHQWCHLEFGAAWNPVAERGVGSCGGEW